MFKVLALTVAAIGILSAVADEGKANETGRRRAPLGVGTTPSGLIRVVVENVSTTVRFDAVRYTTSGRLYGCGFEFRQVVPDHVHELGLPVIMDGSVNVFLDRDHAGVLLKLSGSRIDAATMSREAFGVHYAYPTASGRSLAQKERGTFRCDDGGFCTTYGPEESAAVLMSLFKRELQISFNRNEGSLDVTFLLNIDQAMDADSNLKDGADCLSELRENFDRRGE